MAKTFNDVKLDVKWTKASSRTNIASGENISVSLGKIEKWFSDLGTAAFTASTVYATASHTHSYIPLSGSDAITGQLKINTKSRGLWLTDKEGVSYPAIYDNASNLWIGASATAARHHVGETYISAGYNGTAGNSTIKISVPNADNTNATNYPVLHTGNTSFTQSVTSGTKIGSINIGGTSKDIYAPNKLFVIVS